jgi:hypothetical protein
MTGVIRAYFPFFQAISVVFLYDDLIARDKVNLDIFWLKNDTLDDPDLLPQRSSAPHWLVAQIVTRLSPRARASRRHWQCQRASLAGSTPTSRRHQTCGARMSATFSSGHAVPDEGIMYGANGLGNGGQKILVAPFRNCARI